MTRTLARTPSRLASGSASQLFGPAVLALTIALPACRAASTLKVAGYYDSRNTPNATVTGSATQPERGTRLFGFSDFWKGAQRSRYSEIQLTQLVYQGVGAIVEYNRDFIAPRGTTRVGFFYQPRLPDAVKGSRLSFKFTPVSTHHVGSQVSVSGVKALGRHAYVEGYFDYNPKPRKVVTEWQVGRRITGPLFLVGEFRHNANKARSTGAGIGLEWAIK